MSLRMLVGRLCRTVSIFSAFAIVVGGYSSAYANIGNQGRISQVGGVSISPDGVLSQPVAKAQQLQRDEMLKEAHNAPGDLNDAAELRMISLRGLDEALAKFAGKSVDEIPQELRYLAGIQRLKYVFVFPEERDIILAGPGEGWKVDEQGNVIGITTGRPVLRLEDLMLAFSTVENARKGGVSCSIDPTPEGRRRLDSYLSKQSTFNASVTDAMEKALGEQVITLNGVPTTSRFARIMVASDYRMKRMAMQLEKAPLPGMPSFVELIVKSNTRVDNMMPRWWLACNYEPLAKAEDGMAWELRGRGVKVMTEDELIAADGSVKQTGKVNPMAQKWADTMTAKYDELSVKDTVFGELRNIMDMAVIAALISKERMESKAGISLSHLTNSTDAVKSNLYPTPKKVSTQCTAMKRGKEWVITASGGVDINSWEIASKSVVDTKVSEVRQFAAVRSGNQVIWNKK